MLKRNKKSGFTLLELLVTIVIIGVLAVLSFQGVNQSVTTQKAKNGIQQIGYALNKARYYAKAKGERITVTLPCNSTNYYIETDDDVELHNSSAIDGTSGVLPSGVKLIHSDCYQVIFDIDGKPMESINPDYPLSYLCRVTVGQNNGPQKSLLISPGTGRVVYE